MSELPRTVYVVIPQNWDGNYLTPEGVYSDRAKADASLKAIWDRHQDAELFEYQLDEALK